MNRSALATRRYGAGFTSLVGVMIMIAATTPFLFVGIATPYALLACAMVVRGIGVGLAMMPAMTAAFTSLHHHQVNDASPQLNVIQRVGGTLGTAIIAVVLQNKLALVPGAGTGTYTNAAAVAAAFADTYRWVILINGLALIPAAALWRIERQSRRTGEESEVSEESLIEAVI
jgi:hypothetical protein